MYSAEVIAIGDELTSGQRLDTNSQWISEQLGDLGVRVLYHTTVADDLEANMRVFREAIDRVDIVVATGGLGPTADDLTREAIARTMGVELVLDPAELERLRSLFARRKRPMPEKNVVQAMFPMGTRPIPNPEGTAPGIAAQIVGPGGRARYVFALPGVPAELKQMWPTVASAIAELTNERAVIVHHRIKCFGVGESDLEQMLPDLIRRGREPQVGITVSDATITLRITSRGGDAAECAAAMQPTIEVIRQSLGTLVFGEEDEELEHAVVKLLLAQRKTIAVAEWGSRGQVAHWLAGADPPGQAFLGGVTFGNETSLGPLSSVEKATEQGVTARMAVGCRHAFGADYGLAIGPFPPVDPQGPPPRADCALALPDGGVRETTLPLNVHSSIVRIRAAKQALNLVRLELLKHAGDDPT